VRSTNTIQEKKRGGQSDMVQTGNVGWEASGLRAPRQRTIQARRDPAGKEEKGSKKARGPTDNNVSVEKSRRGPYCGKEGGRGKLVHNHFLCLRP